MPQSPTVVDRAVRRRPAAPPLAPPVGARAWLARDSRAGRVVAHAHGGLLCRVRLEDGPGAGSVVARPGCELLRLADEPGPDR